MTEINENAREEFLSAIQENGLTQERFQQILQAVQSNPDVQKRFQKMQAEKAQAEGQEGEDS